MTSTASSRTIGGRNRLLAAPAVAGVAGVGAAVVSLVQCALGLWLAGWAVPDGEAGRAGALFAAINRLDGVKMLALAAMAAGGAALVRRTHLLAGWLGLARSGHPRTRHRRDRDVPPPGRSGVLGCARCR
jgi:hypothetical protein